MGLLVLGLACAATSFASVFFLAPAESPAAATATETEYVVAAPLADAKKPYTYTPVQEILITIGTAPATRYLKMQVSLATEKTVATKLASSTMVRS